MIKVLLADREGPFEARPGFALATAAALTAAGCPAAVLVTQAWTEVTDALGADLKERQLMVELPAEPCHVVAPARREWPWEPLSELVVAGADGRVDPWVDRETHLSGRPSPSTTVLDPKAFGLQLMQPPGWPPLSPSAVAELQRQALTRKRTTASLTLRLLAGTVLDYLGEATTIMRGVGRIHAVVHSGEARALLG